MAVSTSLLIGAGIGVWVIVLALVWLFCVAAARDERRSMPSVPADRDPPEAQPARQRRRGRG